MNTILRNILYTIFIFSLSTWLPTAGANDLGNHAISAKAEKTTSEPKKEAQEEECD